MAVQVDIGTLRFTKLNCLPPSARGLAQSMPLRAIRSHRHSRQRLGLRPPSAAFPTAMTKLCADVNWNRHMKSSRQPYISKSTYLMGLQCQKLIWFRYNAKDQIPASDEATQAIFDQGTEVGGLPKLEHRQFDAALAAGMNFGMIRFMRKFSIFVLALVCSFNSFARESTLLDSGWRFMQGDPAGVAGQAMSPADPNWIDSSWQAVSIPHNWGWEEAQVGKDYYRGPGWYRRELDVTPEPGKRYFLRFEAASRWRMFI